MAATRDVLAEIRSCGQAVTRLRREVASEAAHTMALWNRAIVREAFRPSASNLAAYLALRRRDISDLQERLSDLGLSSLSRCESRVMPALDAVCAALDVLAGESSVPRRRPERTRDVLASETDRIFGRDDGGPSTRIMVTLPTDAADDPGLIRRAVEAGADCVRINCAHDGPVEWRRMVQNTRKAGKAIGRRIPVLMDLAGPKVRIAAVAPGGSVRLSLGDRFALAPALVPVPGVRIVATVSHPGVLTKLDVGSEVWINDGKIGARVTQIRGGVVRLQVIRARAKGERLRVEKGLNVPGTSLGIPPLTEKDLQDLDFVAQHADLVGYSFVERPEDVVELWQELDRRRRGRHALPLILKIETAEAVRNLPRLIVAAAGRQPAAVMIARGDLAVEIGLSRLSEVQEQILWICEAAHVPVVWATQVLEGLVRTGAPTRGEATDAAMGQRTECVMLNKGAYIVEAVAFLDDVLRRMDRHQRKRVGRLAALKSWLDPQTLPIAVRARRGARTRATSPRRSPARA